MTVAGMTIAFADDVGTSMVAGDTYTIYMYVHTGMEVSEYPLLQTSHVTKCNEVTDAAGDIGVDVEWPLHCRLWTNRRNIGVTSNEAMQWKGIVNKSDWPHGCIVHDLSLHPMPTSVYFNKATPDFRLRCDPI